MALKDSPAPTDSPEPLALLDLLDLQALQAFPLNPASSTLRPGPKVPPMAPVPLENRVLLDPEDSPVEEDSMATEVILAPVLARGAAPQGDLGYLEPREPMASPATPGGRVRPVTAVLLASVAFRDLQVAPVPPASLGVKERRGSLTTPPWVWG